MKAKCTLRQAATASLDSITSNDAIMKKRDKKNLPKTDSTPGSRGCLVAFSVVADLESRNATVLLKYLAFRTSPVALIKVDPNIFLR